MTLQTVNLLDLELIPKREILSGQNLALSSIGLLVLLLSISGWQAMSLGELETLRQQSVAKLEQFQARRETTPVSGDELQQKLVDMQKQLDQQSELLELLGGSDGWHFSQYLTGFAQAKVGGVWLEDIEMIRGQANAVRIGIAGKAREAGKVPELLAALDFQAVFRGYQFSDIEIKPDQDLLYFQITTRGESP